MSSGGKDSSYATWWATLRGWDVAGLVTIRVTGQDSMMFQVPSTALVGMQAASADIPWLPVSIEGLEEAEMTQLEEALEQIVHGSGKPRSDIWSAAERSDAAWPDGAARSGGGVQRSHPFELPEESGRECVRAARADFAGVHVAKAAVGSAGRDQVCHAATQV